jgi:large subunit ribosomal protein L15
MELHQLQADRGLKDKKRVGRGGKRGTYSGRGMKGQKSRSGPHLEPIIRPLIKRYHKLKGASYITSKNKVIATVSLAVLDKNFEINDIVSPQSLNEKNIIGSRHKKLPIVKILGGGELSKALQFENCSFSDSARDKITVVGGKITGERVKKGKKGKKTLTEEQIKLQQENIRKQADKRKAAKKKAIEKRKKEARKSKGKKK